MPATPADAKGLVLAALVGSSPVICLEHRWSHGARGEVPEGWYVTPIGEARVVREGRDATIVALSQMVGEAEKAASSLAGEGIACEILDLRTVRPWDVATVCESVAKTGRLVVADTGWSRFGVGAEIVATVHERLGGGLRSAIRLGLPDAPTPCAPALEAAYYPAAADVVRAVRSLVGASTADGAATAPAASHVKPFPGPF
jgi:pyruvate dehydrogenase E1 component beta subunit